MRSARALSCTAPKQALLLALPVPLLHRLALVVHFLPPRERQLHLGPAAAVEIDRKRHQRQALASHGAVQPGYLSTLEQQFTRPPRLVVEAVAVTVFGNVAVDQPNFLAFDRRIALGDRA